MDKIFELQQQRVDAVKNAQEFATAGEMEKFENAMASVEAIDKQVAAIEASRRIGETKVEKKAVADDQREAFRNALTGNASAIASYQNSYTIGTAATAGNLTAPVQFVNELIKGIDDLCFMRNIAHMTPAIGAAQSLGFPYVSADIADADWRTEVQTVTEESTLAFGRREFKPNRMAKLVKVSKTLLGHSDMAEEVVKERIASTIARTLEKAYISGDGSAKPLGIFTASANGIPASRDVTAALTADGLIDVKYSLKAQYHGRAQWVLHRDAMKTIMKLKDSDGQYIYQPSLIAGQPDTLLGLAVNMSEFAPNTLTTGNYAAVLGDFSNYWICDADTVEMQIMNELYAVTNEVGFLCNYFGDGAPVVAEAFSRLKLS